MGELRTPRPEHLHAVILCNNCRASGSPPRSDDATRLTFSSPEAFRRSRGCGGNPCSARGWPLGGMRSAPARWGVPPNANRITTAPHVNIGRKQCFKKDLQYDSALNMAATTCAPIRMAWRAPAQVHLITAYALTFVFLHKPGSSAAGCPPQAMLLGDHCLCGHGVRCPPVPTIVFAMLPAVLRALSSMAAIIAFSCLGL